MSRLRLTVADEPVELCAERALYWPARRTLAVADLHWGKSATFHRFGVPIPVGVLDDDLARLEQAIVATGAERVLVLGDLIHGGLGLTERVVDTVTAWRARCPAALLLVRGNHDAVPLPAVWGIPSVDSLHEGPFFFRHAPEPEPGAFVWCGHVHPAARIGGPRGIRVPCFHLDPGVGVLPAFSAFTGGGRIAIGRHTRRFAVADGAVWPIAAASPRGRGRTRFSAPSDST